MEERCLLTYQRVLAASLEAGMGGWLVAKLPCSPEPFMAAPLAGAPVAGVVYSAILSMAVGVLEAKDVSIWL